MSYITPDFKKKDFLSKYKKYVKFEGGLWRWNIQNVEFYQGSRGVEYDGRLGRASANPVRISLSFVGGLPCRRSHNYRLSMFAMSPD